MQISVAVFVVASPGGDESGPCRSGRRFCGTKKVIVVAQSVVLMSMVMVVTRVGFGGAENLSVARALLAMKVLVKIKVVIFRGFVMVVVVVVVKEVIEMVRSAWGQIKV